jgi:hypothetical protein
MQQQTENVHMASLREWRMNQTLGVEFIWHKQGRMILYDIMKDRCNDMKGEICIWHYLKRYQQYDMKDVWGSKVYRVILNHLKH